MFWTFVDASWGIQNVEELTSWKTNTLTIGFKYELQFDFLEFRGVLQNPQQHPIVTSVALQNPNITEWEWKESKGRATRADTEIGDVSNGWLVSSARLVYSLITTKTVNFRSDMISFRQVVPVYTQTDFSKQGCELITLANSEMLHREVNMATVPLRTINSSIRIIRAGADFMGPKRLEPPNIWTPGSVRCKLPQPAEIDFGAFSLKIWHLVATNLMIFLRVKWPNFVQNF